MQLTPHLTLKEVAGYIDAEYAGDPGMAISGINEIHRVEKGDITFVDHPKYYNKALDSAATTIIINKKMASPNGKALIFSDDPFRDFVSLIKRFSPFKAADAMISPTAKIGEGTVIQPGAFIGNHVTIGDHCLIHANVTINDHTVIGHHVIIHSGAVLGADAFYFNVVLRITISWNPVGTWRLVMMWRSVPTPPSTGGYLALRPLVPAPSWITL